MTKPNSAEKGEEVRSDLPEQIQNSWTLLDNEEREIANILLSSGQEHLFDAWSYPQAKDADKKRLLAQCNQLNRTYPGGISAYVDNAKALLQASLTGKNPYEDYIPAVPEGESLSSNTTEFDDAEAAGVSVLAETAFVLVAGGLGERLGYHGIKIMLPGEICTEHSFLQMYVDYILAYQTRGRVSSGNPELLLPFVIMTSDDTHSKTVEFLKSNNNFGMIDGQIRIVKQEKVAALIDNNAKFSLNPNDPYEIETKPHGHGDVHTLLHQANVVNDWVSQGVRWIFFFQDTNGPVFRSFPAALGVSVKNKFDVNSLSVPRKPGEAVGAICKLIPKPFAQSAGEAKKVKGGHPLTINVEYNQLESLLPGGVDAADPVTGYSLYPGNINALIFAAQPYQKNLEKSNGGMPEFVNPKYKDKTKTSFKSSTRLECMMQDYPRLLDSSARVGFTQVDRFLAFSPVKNNVADGILKSQTTGFPETASSGESSLYAIGRHLIEQCSSDVVIEPPTMQSFAGIPTLCGAKIVLAPSFGVTQAEIRSKMTGAKINISATSTLVIEGSNIIIKKLVLDGTLIVKAKNHESVELANVVVKNKGWKLKPIAKDQNVDEQFAIRGYTIDRAEQRIIAPSIQTLSPLVVSDKQ